MALLAQAGTPRRRLPVALKPGGDPKQPGGAYPGMSRAQNRLAGGLMGDGPTKEEPGGVFLEGMASITTAGALIMAHDARGQEHNPPILRFSLGSDHRPAG